MKKLLLTTATILSTFAFAQAQVAGNQGTYAYDDFAQADFYKNGSSGEGMIWWEDGTGAYTIERLGDGVMTISANSAGGEGGYQLFGLNFNDSNDDGTGTPFELDLSGGADITMTVENKGSELMFMGITLEDANAVQSKIEPNVADVDGTTWADPNRKGLNGFTLAAGESKTITIDLSSVPGAVGGLTTGVYDCTGPNDCPHTTAAIDPSAITTILFQVNFGSDNLDLTEGDGDPLMDTFIAGTSIAAFTGDIVISSFMIGDIPASIFNTKQANANMTLFPNPASNLLNIAFEADQANNLVITNLLGNAVYSQLTQPGANNIAVNTSELSSGVYMVSVSTATGIATSKLIIE